MRALITATVALLCLAPASGDTAAAATAPVSASTDTAAGYRRLTRQHAARYANAPTGWTNHAARPTEPPAPSPCGVAAASEPPCVLANAAPSGGDARGVGHPPPFDPPDDLFFVVAVPDYSEHCGGCMVLHRLCDRLNVMYDAVRATPLCYVESVLDLGHTRPLGLNPGYKTPLLPAWMNASAGIALYPETVTGNPLNAGRIVSWILYFPGVNGGPPAAEYDPRRLIACFSPGFCADFNASNHATVPLRVLDYEFEHYLNVQPPPAGRAGVLTFRRKPHFSSPTLGRISVADTVFPVPETPLQDEDKRSRIEQYARAERFYTADPATFRSVEAAMAGTLSVVMPVPGVTKAEWLASVGDEFKVGVAYGEDDIPHAQATLPCVMPLIRHKAIQERDIVDRFVRRAVSFFASQGW
jgi:hypothetical protein